MDIPRKIKDPDSIVPYDVQWHKWLITGDTIVSSEWLIPDGITDESESNTDTMALVWLSGGELGQQYLITNRITTAQGMTEDQSIRISLEQK